MNRTRRARSPPRPASRPAKARCRSARRCALPGALGYAGRELPLELAARSAWSLWSTERSAAATSSRPAQVVANLPRGQRRRPSPETIAAAARAAAGRTGSPSRRVELRARASCRPIDPTRATAGARRPPRYGFAPSVEGRRSAPRYACLMSITNGGSGVRIEASAQVRAERHGELRVGVDRRSFAAVLDPATYASSMPASSELRRARRHPREADGHPRPASVDPCRVAAGLGCVLRARHARVNHPPLTRELPASDRESHRIGTYRHRRTRSPASADWSGQRP